MIAVFCPMSELRNPTLALNRYLEDRVLGATPLELVQILYDAALASVRSARRHLASGDILARSREITRGQLLVGELTSSLDRKAGGELGDRLFELYDYMQRRLTEAHIEQSDEPLAEVGSLLSTLLEGWRPRHENVRSETRVAIEESGVLVCG